MFYHQFVNQLFQKQISQTTNLWTDAVGTRLGFMIFPCVKAPYIVLGKSCKTAEDLVSIAQLSVFLKLLGGAY